MGDDLFLSHKNPGSRRNLRNPRVQCGIILSPSDDLARPLALTLATCEQGIRLHADYILVVYRNPCEGSGCVFLTKLLISFIQPTLLSLLSPKSEI